MPAAVFGIALFDEPVREPLLASAVRVLGGIALAVRRSLALRPAR